MSRSKWLGRWANATTLTLALLAAPLGGCAEKSPQTSSESHWVTCNVDSECTAYVAGATCQAGFCVDSAGQRLATPTPNAAVSSGATAEPSVTGLGPSASVSSDPLPLDSASPVTSDSLVDASPISDSPTQDSAAQDSAAQDSATDAGFTSETGAAPQADAGCTTPAAAQDASQVHTGDYLLTDATSLQTLMSVAEITGTLTIQSRNVDQLGEVELLNLRRIGGGLSLTGSALTRVSLPWLQNIVQDVNVTSNVGLLELDLRSLQQVQGEVIISGNPSLRRVRLDTLSAAGGLQLSGAALAQCELDTLFARLAQPALPGARTDCSCTSLCSWLEVACPD